MLSTLTDWLTYIATVYPHEMKLGLDRIKTVAVTLDLLHPDCPVILVGGTNGKGSTVAGLKAIYRAAGYHVGAFTSPILFRHNEYVVIDGHCASDADFVAAYEKIDAARGEVTLTPFEFHTLAALLIFKAANLDVIILEVGLGGRFDAVNIMNPDLSIVTSIGLDHIDILGDTREKIATEKAGIFRTNKPAICGDPLPPSTLFNSAARFYCQGKEFGYEDHSTDWSWFSPTVSYAQLPKPNLLLQNMSTVLMAITLLQTRLPVDRKAIDLGLSTLHLVGRIQVVPGPVTQIFDVSHNPDAVTLLAKYLQTHGCAGKTHAVFSMLADKDIRASVAAIQSQITDWHVAPLSIKRAASLDKLQNVFHDLSIQSVTFHASIELAYAAALQSVVPGDCLVTFGSFHTVQQASALVQLIL